MNPITIVYCLKCDEPWWRWSGKSSLCPSGADLGFSRRTGARSTWRAGWQPISPVDSKGNSDCVYVDWVLPGQICMSGFGGCWFWQCG